MCHVGVICPLLGLKGLILSGVRGQETWLFHHSNWEYAYHYHLINYVNKAMCLPHVSATNNNNNIQKHIIVIVCGNNMWSTQSFVNINNEMLMICILPVRVKEQLETPDSLTGSLYPQHPTKHLLFMFGRGVL